VADWDLRGDVLASARQAAGLSQRALAAAINVADEDRVRLWERGEARPQARVIPLIAEAIGVEPLALLTGASADVDLTRLRVAAGLSLKEMAARTGLPITSYHRLERRGAPQGGIDAESAKVIADALDVAPDQVAALLTRSTS
jgi:transcriptional regulator with XRE-family HTH domain